MSKFEKKKLTESIIRKTRVLKDNYITHSNRQYIVNNLLRTFTIAFCLLSLLCNCDRSDMESDFKVTPVMESEFRGVYPKYQSLTRTENNGFWESWDQITLYTGQKVNTPWNPSGTSSTVPSEFLLDIKYDDGWDLIYYEISKNEEEYHGNRPLMVFHNRYTGILKVFCYFMSDAFGANNHGIWQIFSENPTSIFAFQNNPISLTSDKQNKTYNVSNITTSSTKGFTLGWNCFQIELAYDPNQSGRLHISTLACNSVQISLTGNLEAETNGLMTTSEGNKQNSLKNGIAKIAGNGAEKWINQKLGDKTILGISASTIAQGVKAVVSGGVGSIIGAITGLFKSDNTSKSLQLTTNGTFSCNGEATFVSTVGIEPIQFSIDPERVGYLGVWGLKEEPTLKLSPYAVLNSIQEYTNGYTSEYRISIINQNFKTASVLFNPNLSQFVKSKTYSLDYFYSNNIRKRFMWGNYGVLGRDPRNMNKVYDDLYKPKYYIIADVAFKGEEDAYIPVGQYEPPMEIFIPNVPNGPEGALPDFMYDSHYLAAIGVKLTLPNGSEAYSYHHCIPKIDWNWVEYEDGFYQYLYPYVPLTQSNSTQLNMQSTGLEKLSGNHMHIKNNVFP